jgi:hypothetical protein
VADDEDGAGKSGRRAKSALARTVMHDPDEPHPWDEDGPPTGEADSVAPNTFTDLGSRGSDALVELDVAEDLVPRRRAELIGLVIGAGLGLLVVLLVSVWLG